MGIAGRGEAKEEWGGAMGVHAGAAAVVFLVVLREILAAAGFLSQGDQGKLICCLLHGVSCCPDKSTRPNEWKMFRRFLSSIEVQR